MMGVFQMNLDEINKPLMLLPFPTRGMGLNHISLCINQKEQSIRDVMGNFLIIARKTIHFQFE